MLMQPSSVIVILLNNLSVWNHRPQIKRNTPDRGFEDQNPHDEHSSSDEQESLEASQDPAEEDNTRVFIRGGQCLLVSVCVLFSKQLISNLIHVQIMSSFQKDFQSSS